MEHSSDRTIVRSVMAIATVLEVFVVLAVGLGAYTFGKYQGVTQVPANNISVYVVDRKHVRSVQKVIKSNEVILPLKGVISVDELAGIIKKAP